MSAKLSILIPSRNEQFLPQTIAGLLARAAGEIEIIAVLDGYWPNPPLANDKRLRLIHFSEARGMRAAINAAARVSTGDYLMKCDAHCLFAEGFDETLKADCAPDWVVIPRRYSLDAENWSILETGKSPVDYEYLGYPWHKPAEIGIHGTVWAERARERKAIELDENMGFQGSCWFTPRAHFYRLGGLRENGYGTFIGEPQELGNKSWLSGGRVMVNKKTWYAHLHKGKRYGRGYSVSKSELGRGNLYSVAFWLNDCPFTGRTHNFDWLVERFWPVPTWPADWREQLEQRRKELVSYL